MHWLRPAKAKIISTLISFLLIHLYLGMFIAIPLVGYICRENDSSVQSAKSFLYAKGLCTQEEYIQAVLTQTVFAIVVPFIVLYVLISLVGLKSRKLVRFFPLLFVLPWMFLVSLGFVLDGVLR